MTGAFLKKLILYILLGIGGAVLILALLGGLGAWWIHHLYELPSDKNALAYFHEHRADFEEILATLNREPNIEFVDASFIGVGANAKDPAHIACAKLLRRAGAKSLSRDKEEGSVSIVVWGFGCAVCVDVWKGFEFVPTSSSVLTHFAIMPNLEDSTLPKTASNVRGQAARRY